MGDITLYHKSYNEQTRLDEWKRTQFCVAHWHEKQAVTVEKGGLTAANIFTVRIFTNETIAVENGDYIVKGLCEFEKPQAAETFFLITAVIDNRKGSPCTHHWRIEGK